MNATENNTLIAKFMNLDLYHPESLEYKIGNTVYSADQLPFASSWDWLIPVVEKCRECQIFGSQRLISNIDERLMKLDLIATYRNVIDFIEFYNINQ